MFAKDVLRVLQVSRPTLTKYVKTGIIRVHVMPNGHCDYNEEVLQVPQQGCEAQDLHLCSRLYAKAEA